MHKLEWLGGFAACQQEGEGHRASVEANVWDVLQLRSFFFPSFVLLSRSEDNKDLWLQGAVARHKMGKLSAHSCRRSRYILQSVWPECSTRHSSPSFKTSRSRRADWLPVALACLLLSFGALALTVLLAFLLLPL